MRVPAPAPSRIEQALRLPFAALAFAILLNADRTPFWCSLTAVIALVWRIGAAQGRWPLPPTWLRTVATLGLVVLAASLFRSLGGLTAGSTLLITMGSLKLLETRSVRDGRILVGAALFLLVAACLDRQSLARLPLYAVSTGLSVAALLSLGSSATGGSPRLALRRAGRDLAFALPFAIACFLFFPRFAGPLWGAPEGARGITGLADEMSPGSITELATSDDIAFRVRFDGRAPSPRQRYWRGPVLHDFDGFTWRRGTLPPFPPSARDATGTMVKQDITLEPNGRGFAFALDVPESVEATPGTRILLDNDRHLRLFRAPSQQVNYRVVSLQDPRDTTPLPGWLRRTDLRLPEGSNARSHELARRLRAANPRDADFAKAMLAHFRNGGFQYSLTPPPLQQDSVDDLLFRTREGFCGHFASAFTMLMRAGGVPARVVTGYLGGEWNGYGSYFTVRQAEAHAWSEIWLEGSGWTRVDPTAEVQPARLDESLRSLLPDESLGGTLRQAAWARALIDYWDAGNQWWQQRVVGFNLQSQRGLLERFGVPDADYRLLAGLCLALSSAWLGLVAWRLRRGQTPRQDAVARTWELLREALEKSGVAGLRQAGPLDLARRGAAVWPDLRPPLEAVARDYAQLRYATPDIAQAIDEAALRRAIRSLLPRLRYRHRLKDRPGLSAASLQLLSQRLPLYARMPESLRQRSASLARDFLKRTRFEGCGGLVVTEEMRVLVAFQASMLVAHRGLSPYSDLRSVLLYPDEFLVQRRIEDEDGVVTEGTDALSGQAEDTSRVLLSWRDIEQGLAEDCDYNVVLHEFAHVLDHALGDDLRDLIQAGHDALCDTVDAGESTLIDPYGAEDPVEFFAVCTEAFFGLPVAFKSTHADLHAALVTFYGCDPATWEDIADSP